MHVYCFSDMPLVAIFFTIVLTLICYWWYTAWRIQSKLSWIPQPPGLPLIGNSLQFGKSTDLLGILLRWTKQYGGLYQIQIAMRRLIIITDYNFLEFLLPSTKILSKGQEYQFFKRWLGAGLLTATGDRWKKNRKIITPAFHFSILEGFIPTFEANDKILIDELEKEVDKDSVDIYPYITMCTLDIICETAMGVSINAQKNTESEYVVAVKELCRIIIERSFSPIQRLDVLYSFTRNYRIEEKSLKILHNYTNSVIKTRKEELKNKTNEDIEEDQLEVRKKRAFLDLLLNATIDGSPLPDNIIREEVDTFMFEGHDTTASAISSTLFCLANHAEIQGKAVEEQRAIFGNDRSRNATSRDFQDMKYLELVIKEALRLYPPVPFYSRETKEDIAYKGSQILKKKKEPNLVLLIISPLLSVMDMSYQKGLHYLYSLMVSTGIQTSSRIPKKFDPTRFENANKTAPYSYIPFSAGPRNCIGQKFAIMEMKSVISNVLRHYELLATCPRHELMLAAETVLKSANGVRIKIRKRDWNYTFVLRHSSSMIAILLAVLVVYVVFKVSKNTELSRKLHWIPAIPRWPIIGNILEFGDNTETLYDMGRLVKNHGKLIKVYVFMQPNILTADYEFLEFLLGTQKVLNKSHDYNFLHKWLSTGLLTSDGFKWKKRRKMVTPAFHFSILEKFVDCFDSNGRILAKKLEDEVDNESVEIYHYINLYALDVICVGGINNEMKLFLAFPRIAEAAMGVPINAQKHEDSDYVRNVKQMGRIVMDRAFSATKSNNFLYMLSRDYYLERKLVRELHDVTTAVINTRRKELATKRADGEQHNDLGRKKNLAFLDILLQSTIDGEPLSSEDIREEVDTFMFEGHDTTSSAISFTIFLLANHPEVQKQAFEEQKEIFGDDADRSCTVSDLNQMRYLELVIKEGLRIYPPVPMYGRSTNEDIEYKGNVIPKGINISVYAYGILRDPEYFPEPDKFDPSRFMHTDGTKPYSYIPFSAGPRNCIGQKFAVLEVKSCLSKLLRKFEILPTIPEHKPILVMELILKSKNGIKVKLTKRKW
ncbi:hypothetical protein NQ318_002596 [Aromia moschata]|uniref:Cytochrome P450 n=1 Tax=Aromia moschata TaxID=1265417 RepID=A0AAV8XZR2_9CUCU|nr:hypothetical protein NQ318_002596 [Aromia moschata]